MKFLAEDDKLTITLEGTEVLWGLKHKLTVPRESIVDLVWMPEFNTDDLLLRIGGSNVPGLLLAGSFRDVTSKETLFVYLRHPKGYTLNRTMHDVNVLRITLQDFRYAEIIISCDPDMGASLMNWFGVGRS